MVFFRLRAYPIGCNLRVNAELDPNLNPQAGNQCCGKSGRRRASKSTPQTDKNAPRLDWGNAVIVAVLWGRDTFPQCAFRFGVSVRLCLGAHHLGYRRGRLVVGVGGLACVFQSRRFVPVTGAASDDRDFGCGCSGALPARVYGWHENLQMGTAVLERNDLDRLRRSED